MKTSFIFENTVYNLHSRIFRISQSDAFMSGYLTDLKFALFVFFTFL